MMLNQQKSIAIHLLFAALVCLQGGAVFSQTIPTPTQTDEIIIDNGQSGKADSGDRIRYAITITETGGTTNATGVQVTVSPDALTTFVGGSFRTSPLALPNSYTCIGNVGITVGDGANDLLANDFDDNPAGLTITPVTNATTTGGGQITINSNGSFSYTPAPGFDGTDTYSYTLNDGNGVGGSVPSTDLGVVSIAVSNMIWFIDASAPFNGDGRLETPFNNINSFVASSLDATGETIFLYSGTYNSGAVLALLAQQKLIGQGASASIISIMGISLPIFSKTLPATFGARPTISRASDVLHTPNQNLIRGFNITNTAGTGITGSSFTSLTASEVSVTGSNGAAAVNFNNGSLNATFTSISATSCTNGIALTNCSGNMTVEDGTLTNSTAADALVSGGSVNFTFSGSITDNSGLAVDIDNHDSGNVTFQTGNITSTGEGIRVQNCDGGTKTFANPSKSLSTGTNTAVNLSFNNGATVNFTGGGLVITTNNCLISFNAVTAGTLNVTGSGNTINAPNSATALRITDVNAGASGITFASVITTNGNIANIQNSTGTKTLGRISTTNTGNQGMFLESAGTVNVGDASNASTITTSNANCITIYNSTLNLSGMGLDLTATGAGGGLNMTGGTVSITGGGLDITTNSGTGFNATSGGTVSLTGSNNTINSTSATALNVANTTIGASGLTFRSISSGNNTAAADPANGIVLNTTGTSGGLTVTGTGGAGSGGTIQNCTSTGISMTSTRNHSFTRMQLNDFGDFAIRGTSVVNFTMDNTVVSGTNGNDGAANEGSVSFSELTGTASVTNCNISGGLEDNFSVVNTSGSLNRITFSSCTFGANSTTDGSDGILVEGQNAAIVNVTVQNSTFTSTRGDHCQVNVIGTASTDFVFTGNTVTNSHPAVVSGGGGIRLTGGSAGANVTGTYNISNNTIRDSNGTAIGVTKGAGSGTFTGTIDNNQIGVAGVTNSGSAAGSGISVITAEAGTSTTTITNNQVRQYNNFGIIVQAGGLPTVGTGSLKATVTGNTISNPGNLVFAKNGFQLNSGTVPGDAFQVCLTFGGAGALRNSLVGTGTDGGTDFRLRQRQSTTVRLPGYGGANNDDAAVVTFAQGNNNLGGTPTGSATNTVPTGGGWLGSACPF